MTRVDLYAVIIEGAIERLRPKMMTVVAIMAEPSRSCGALAPAPGSAAHCVPMIGDIVSSTILTQIVILAVYALVRVRPGTWLGVPATAAK